MCAVRSIPKPSEASTSADERPRGTLRNMWSLLQDVAATPLFGVNADSFASRLSAFLAADRAAEAAQRQRELRLREFIACLTAVDSSSFSSAHIDEILSDLSSL